jgi:hypothetical protein
LPGQEGRDFVGLDAEVLPRVLQAAIGLLQQAFDLAAHGSSYAHPRHGGGARPRSRDWAR